MSLLVEMSFFESSLDYLSLLKYRLMMNHITLSTFINASKIFFFPKTRQLQTGGPRGPLDPILIPTRAQRLQSQQCVHDPTAAAQSTVGLRQQWSGNGNGNQRRHAAQRKWGKFGQEKSEEAEVRKIKVTLFTFYGQK